MGFIKIPGLGDMEEQVVAPEGTYDLTITSAEEYKKLDNGQRVSPDYEGGGVVGHNVQMQISFDGQPNYKPFTHWLALPREDEDEEKRETKSRMVRGFIELIGALLDGDGFNSDDFIGLSFSGTVTQESRRDSNGNETGELNNKLLVPRF